ncbi:DotH/IcmK family type IV secretion protein [Micavibrio aeruginosavorus]|uniref:IcmK (DotH) protein n=1 Tax=Micavibrio aeruginosavorus EPB TaxID=349215 RepID=M4VM01_9BACT|nr:DotH/IcmK family type IV secretion protein [Micavibrio aeruginosavorus]AGH99161.1 IcmK (DotH) protein [Micavibrio aeruginosavorus EPB]
MTSKFNRYFQGLHGAVRPVALGAVCVCLAGTALSVLPAVAQDALPPGLAAQMDAEPPADDLVAQDDSALPPAMDAMERAPGLALPEDAGLAPVEGGMDMDLAEKSPEDIEAEIREDAFEAAITGLLPMRPEEIRELLKRYDQTLEAVQTPLQPYPEPEVVVQTVALDPGVRPSEIKVAVGHVTTLNFVDVTGAPWPIEDVSWAGDFEILKPGEGGWVLRVTPMQEFAYGNLSVKLLELKTPITFVMNTRRDTVHYRMDARIPEYGPYAKPPIIDGGITIAAGNAAQASILDGIIPDSAEKLVVSGVDGRTTAYRFKGNVYVRTPLTMLSPGWSGSVSSADGMNVYTIEDAPVLLLSDKGRMVRAHLSEKDDSDEQ